MTVCIAQIIAWKYDEEMGTAILTASDREITAGDVEYEPNQQKICYLGKHMVALIAGDFGLHSSALARVQRQLLADPQTDPRAVADLYSDALKELKRREAETHYLSPLGLTLESFQSRQREFSPEFVDRITNQLQQYQGAGSEALVVGMDQKTARIYEIDSLCRVICHDDVGFAAIGIGAWHAKSMFMQAKYTNTTVLAPAFAILYLAKKRAEIAPGVGKTTDYNLITRHGWSALVPRLVEKAHEVFAEYERLHTEWAKSAVAQLNESLNDPKPSAGHLTIEGEAVDATPAKDATSSKFQT